MTTSREELEAKSVEELREMAGEIGGEALAGAAEMPKEELVPVLARAFGLEGPAAEAPAEPDAGAAAAAAEAAPAAAPPPAGPAIDKVAVKRRLRELKQERTAALQATDRGRLRTIRRDIRRLKRTLRRAAAG